MKKSFVKRGIAAVAALFMVAAGLCLPLTANATEEVANGSNGYLWLHFEATDYEKIYYGYSADGLNWKKLNNNQPLITSDVANKGIRDPHLIKLQEPDDEGYKYVMIGTDLHAEGTAGGGDWSQQSQNLIVSRSKDLVTWTDAEAISGGWDNADRMWAPEAIWDPETNDYLVYYSSKPKGGSLLGVYKVHTTDFRSFTQPQGVSGDPTPWVYQGTTTDGSTTNENIIDSTIVKGDDGDYYRFSTSDWYTVVDTAETLDGNWTRIVERDSDVVDDKSRITGDTVAMKTSEAGLNGIEGLTVFQKPDGTWVIMGDNQGYKAFQIEKLSDLKTGTAPSSATASFNKRFRHGTVVALTAAEQEAVLDAYGPKPAEEGTAWEDNNGIIVGSNASLTEDSRYGKVLNINSAWTSGTSSVNGPSAAMGEFSDPTVFNKTAWTLYADVKMKDINATSDDANKQPAFTIGTADQAINLLLGNGKLGFGTTTGGYSGTTVPLQETATSDQWASVALVYSEENNTGNVAVYLNGVQVLAPTDIDFTLSNQSNTKAFVGHGFNSNFALTGSYDNIVLKYSAASEDDAKAETANRQAVKNPVEAPNSQIAQYDFENADNRGEDTKGEYDLTFSGTPEFGVPGDWNTTVMQLRPANNAYAEFPTGMFDGRDSFSLEFEAKSRASSGNFFSFAIGSSDQKYLLIKLTGTEFRSKITTNRWTGEQGVTANINTLAWHRYTVTVEPDRIAVYADDQLIGENTDITVSVSDLGENLQAYIGKSFYSGDALWDGGVDKIKVYNYARTVRDIVGDVDVKSAVIGTVPADPSTEVGTDDHTALYAKVDAESGTITTTLNSRAAGELASVPANLTLNRNDAQTVLTLDGEPFGTQSEDGYSFAGTFDATRDHELVVTSTEEDDTVVTKTWTLKAAAVSNNPVLPGQYADPDIDYFPGENGQPGKFWIYPTTDGFSGWSGNYFHAWSSDDLVNWTDEGVILDVNAANKPADGQEANPDDYDGSNVDNIAFSPWSIGSAWAPTIEAKEIDGQMKYFFYYCAKKGNGESAIGVAVADNPAGPFVPADEPLVSRTMEGVTVGQAIDPSIFTDDDGTSYILYGNGNAAIAQLGDDMTSIVPNTVRQLHGLTDFRESVVVMKHGGKYHWTWSCDDAGSENYHVNYGVSDSLDGDITVKTQWLVGKDTSNGIQGTAHQSDVTVTDGTGRERTFIAYHRHYTPLGVYTSGLGYHRETAISEISFDVDGYMQTVDVTRNIEPVQMERTDYSELETALDAARALSESDYTTDSWSAYLATGTLDTAEQVLATKDDEFTAYQSDVDESSAALTDAMNLLVEFVPVPADSSSLQDAVDAAKPDSDASGYSADSWSAYQDALANAEAVLANADATQEQVDAALTSLQDAEDALEPVDTPGPEPEPGEVVRIGEETPGYSFLRQSVERGREFTFQEPDVVQGYLSRAVTAQPSAGSVRLASVHYTAVTGQPAGEYPFTVSYAMPDGVVYEVTYTPMLASADSESADTSTGGLPSTGDTVMGLSALAVLLAIAGISLLAWHKRQA